jgi:tetratricopeptide (TPR) repeat protein
MLGRTILRLAAAFAVALWPAFAGLASADELADVYARIIANPVDSALNLQYALIAEGRGEYRKALAAYERVLVNDPGNEAARRGLQRVRRIIEPAVTLRTLEFGARVDSNPTHATAGGEADVLGYGRLSIRDERPLGGHRWRTVVNAYGEAHARETELNYASLNAETGPLIDLDGSMMTFRPALGGGAAFFDGRFYYADVNASAALEGYLQGAYQWARLRAGYRQYDPSFTADEGFYADLSGKWSFQDVVHDNDVFSIAPRLRWSGIEGLPADDADEFAPGLYVEAGTAFEYSKAITSALAASLNARLNRRWYRDIGGGARQDFLVSPGAGLIFTGLFGVQTDLRVDYRYEWNDSTDDAHDWQNHSVKVGVSVRR